MIDLLLLMTLATASLYAAIQEARREASVRVGRRWGILPHRLRLSRHICIYGPTRSGKTSFIRALVRELAKNFVVTVLDWHGEYTDIEGVPSIPYNMLNLNLETMPKKLLAEVLGHGLGLTEASMYLLYRVLKNAKIEEPRDVIRAVDEYFAVTRAEAEMKAAILRRLEYVLTGLTSGIVDTKLLTEYSCSIDLSNLVVIEEKRLASSLILAMLYVHYMNTGLVQHLPRHFIVIEEAQNLLSQGSILDHILLELAKYGVRVILVTNVLPSSYLLKHCTLIMFKTRPEQVERELVISDEVRMHLLNMRENEVLIIEPNGIVRVIPIKDRGRREYVRKSYISSDDVLQLHEEGSTDVDTNEQQRQIKEKNPVNNAQEEEKQSRDTNSSPVRNTVNVEKYVKKLDEIEERLALLRERLDEIERMLSYEEEVLNKIASRLSI